jgi:MYXO-CTERM domain-containing protein
MAREKESSLLRVAGIATALAAIVGLPVAAFDLYQNVSALQDTVDEQALELENQRQELENQERQIELQEQALQVQKEQFREFVDLTAPHYRDEAVERRLLALRQAIDDAAGREGGLSDPEAGFSPTGTGDSGVAKAQAHYEAARRAWNLRDYDTAEDEITAGLAALEPPVLGGSDPGPDPTAPAPGPGLLAAVAAVALAAAAAARRRAP